MINKNIIKILFVLSILLLAAFNKWYFTPRLQDPKFAKQLGYAILFEMSLGLSICWRGPPGSGKRTALHNQLEAWAKNISQIYNLSEIYNSVLNDTYLNLNNSLKYTFLT